MRTYVDTYWARTGTPIEQARGGLRDSVDFRTAALICEANSKD